MRKVLFVLLCMMTFLSTAKAIEVVNTYTLEFFLEKPIMDRPATPTFYRITEVGKSEFTMHEVDTRYKISFNKEKVSKILVEEVGCDGRLICDYDVYEIDFTENSNQTIKKKYDTNIVTVNLTFFYEDISNNVKYEYNPIIKIFNAYSNKMIMETSEKNIDLIVGSYYIYDVTTDKYYYYDTDVDGLTPEFITPMINLLRVVGGLESICNEEKCFEFDEIEGSNYFETPLIPGYYTINNRLVYLDDSLFYDNKTAEYELLVNLEDYPLIESPKEDDYVIQEIPKLDDEKQDDSVIVVDVPDTGLTLDLDVAYYVEKKYFIIN